MRYFCAIMRIYLTSQINDFISGFGQPFFSRERSLGMIFISQLKIIEQSIIYIIYAMCSKINTMIFIKNRFFNYIIQIQKLCIQNIFQI